MTSDKTLAERLQFIAIEANDLGAPIDDDALWAVIMNQTLTDLPRPVLVAAEKMIDRWEADYKERRYRSEMWCRTAEYVRHREQILGHDGGSIEVRRAFAFLEIVEVCGLDSEAGQVYLLECLRVIDHWKAEGSHEWWKVTTEKALAYRRRIRTLTFQFAEIVKRRGAIVSTPLLPCLSTVKTWLDSGVNIKLGTENLSPETTLAIDCLERFVEEHTKVK